MPNNLRRTRSKYFLEINWHKDGELEFVFFAYLFYAMSFSDNFPYISQLAIYEPNPLFRSTVKETIYCLSNKISSIFLTLHANSFERFRNYIFFYTNSRSDIVVFTVRKPIKENRTRVLYRLRTANITFSPTASRVCERLPATSKISASFHEVTMTI